MCSAWRTVQLRQNWRVGFFGHRPNFVRLFHESPCDVAHCLRRLGVRLQFCWSARRALGSSLAWFCSLKIMHSCTCISSPCCCSIRGDAHPDQTRLLSSCPPLGFAAHSSCAIALSDGIMISLLLLLHFSFFAPVVILITSTLKAFADGGTSPLTTGVQRFATRAV